MAGASDKARFYLEQSIPELREFERKKIFTKAEISSITKKRSEFEHKLNDRGSQPSDYARYVEYEMNLESLRRKRIRRLGIKATSHAGQRRILFILDRATRKFHGDVGLWIQHLQYAKNQRAFKKLAQILASVLRLHPTKAELWIYAANLSMDAQGDMTEARSYMQRGLRFCKQSKELWLEYARLELIYILKIVARQKILGLDENRPKKNLPHFAEEFDKDYFALPIITAENINPHLRTDKTVDEVAFKPVISTPALLGAIALAIFDAAMGQFKTPQLGERFFDMIADFDGLPCQESLLQHIVDTLVALEPNHSATLNCSIRQPLIGVHCISAIFPTALSETLSRLKTAMEGQPPLELLLKTVNWQLRYLEEERLDSDIRKALSSTMSKTLKKYIEISKTRGEGSGVEFATILEKALSRGHDELRFSVTPMALEVWPASELLLALLRVV